MFAARLIVVCVVVVVSVGCGSDATEIPVDSAGRDAADAATASSRESLATRAAGSIVVDVAGHVGRPGVYRLDPGSRVHDAIRAAGGVRVGADLTLVNRAAEVTDGQQVLVARAAPAGASAQSGESGPGSDAAAPAAAVVPTGPVSLNSADAAALDSLPGIGPVTAGRIVEDRAANGPFTSVDDLDRVPGIGPATIDSLRDVVTT